MKYIFYRIYSWIFYTLLCMVFLQTSSVIAHPHSWVSVLTELEGDSNQMTGVKMFWTFDLITTSDALNGLDLSEQNRQASLQLLADGMLNNIKENNYYTHLTHHDKALTFKDAQQAELSLENSKLTLQFFMPLEMPVSLPISDLKLQVYEDTYFVDFLWEQNDDVQLSESFHADCQLNIKKPQATAEQISFISSLEIGDLSDSRMGAMFTQSVNINCF